MYRLSLGIIAIAVLAATACENTAKPSETLAFTAVLSPANEVPPITNAEAGASGLATIVLHVSRDSAGAISIAIVDFQVGLVGFPSSTPVTMAHIHRGGVGINGDIVLNTGLTAGEVTLPNGSGTFAKNGVTMPVSLAKEILATPSNFYFNVHTAANPNGAVRGQVVRQ